MTLSLYKGAERAWKMSISKKGACHRALWPYTNFIYLLPYTVNESKIIKISKKDQQLANRSY